MSDNIVFISYTKHDNNSVMYLEEVKKHLSSLVRQKKCIIWDDTLIEPGKLWKSEIEKAMNRARVAIFLVGPAFLGSEFITETELPTLLKAAKTNGIRIFPLIIDHCTYKGSILEPYQACNDVTSPFITLDKSKISEIINNLSISVEKYLFDLFQQQPCIPEQSHMTDLEKKYCKEYSKSNGYMLVHDYQLSTIDGMKFDIFIYIVKHKKGDPDSPHRTFEEIKSAEFFFGSSWGNEIYPVDNNGGLIGIRVNAWGTFFSACRLIFKDNNLEPIILYRYIDFERKP